MPVGILLLDRWHVVQSDIVSGVACEANEVEQNKVKREADDRAALPGGGIGWGGMKTGWSRMVEDGMGWDGI